MSAETLTEPNSLPQVQKNEELLRNSEFGVILEEAYIGAVNRDPRLEDVAIVPLEPDSSKLGFARPAWRSESGKHEVHLRLDNLDDALAKHQQVLDTIPGAREIFAQRIGIKPENMTAELSYTFAVLHELGHVTEYMDHEDNPGELVRRSKVEKAALPIGNATVGAIMDTGSGTRQMIDGRWDEIQASLGVQTIDDLIGLQHDAYRNLSSEAHADYFASDVLAVNPVLTDRLSSPGAAERYRDYPVAA